METLLKQELGCSSVKATGHSGGGCISQGQSYDTDKGRVFVKVNSKAEVGPPAPGEGRARWPEAKIGLWFGSRVCEILSWPGLGSARDFGDSLCPPSTARRFPSGLLLPCPCPLCPLQQQWLCRCSALVFRDCDAQFFEKAFPSG